MKLSQRLMTGIAAFGLAGGAAAATAGPASAATASPNAAAACQIKTETTNAVGTNVHGLPEVYGGTTFTKPSSSTTTCHDLNVWTGQNGVSYEGWLYYGNGNWGACQAGYVRYNGSPIVLCTNVLPNTLMAVTASNGAGHSFQVEI